MPGHYITNVTLENIEISLAGGGTVENSRQAVPEAIDKYPEVKTFGPTIPAYGIWARHVKGLTLKNVTFHLAGNDVRPAFICEDGQQVSLLDWKIPPTTGGQSVIRLQQVTGATVSQWNVEGNAEAFVRVEGSDSNDIRIYKNNAQGMKPVALSSEVNAKAAKLK